MVCVNTPKRFLEKTGSKDSNLCGSGMELIDEDLANQAIRLTSAGLEDPRLFISRAVQSKQWIIILFLILK